ncbi:MAG: metalloregulator ArsR/SmtB family transcription factor [Polyangiaceae bacterium]
MTRDGSLNLVFSALSDSTRRAMLVRLAQGEATVTELAAPFDMAQPTISKHLRVLEEAGLIRMARDAQRRPRSLVIGGPLEEVDAWLVPFREQWERRFDRLESFLGSRAKAKAKKRTFRAKDETSTKNEKETKS